MDNNGLGGGLSLVGSLYPTWPQPVPPSANPLDADYITLSAWSSTTTFPPGWDPSTDPLPAGFIESQTGTLKTNGSVTVTFSNAVSKTGSYYLRVIHRNALESWSTSPFVFGSTTAGVPYDFTTSQGQTKGNNSIDVGTPLLESPTFAFFSGDIASDAVPGIVGLQDGKISSEDYGSMETAVYFTILGYQFEDIWQDQNSVGIAESADYGGEENNVYFTRVAQRP